MDSPDPLEVGGDFFFNAGLEIPGNFIVKTLHFEKFKRVTATVGRKSLQRAWKKEALLVPCPK